MKFIKDKVNKSWLLGVCEFNSFFVVNSCDTNCMTSFIEYLSFYYIVKVDNQNIATLYRFKCVMGVGKIVSDNFYSYYYVCRDNYLYDKIVKFFSSNKLISFKRVEYERFRYVLHKKYFNQIGCNNVEYLNNYIKKYCVCYKNLIEHLNSIISNKRDLAIAKFNFYKTIKIFLIFLILYVLKDRVQTS